MADESISARDIFEHEASSFTFMYEGFRTGVHHQLNVAPLLKQALLESGLPHLRLLADMLLSKGGPDDVKLKDLTAGHTPDWLSTLETAYGTSKNENSPCWILNKMLVHPSTKRERSYDYSALLNSIGPLILAAIDDVRGQKR
jgi:hypothetical protein